MTGDDSDVKRVEAEVEGLLREYAIGVRQEMACKITPSELNALKDKLTEAIFTRHWNVCVLKGQRDMYDRLSAPTLPEPPEEQERKAARKVVDAAEAYLWQSQELRDAIRAYDSSTPLERNA